MLTHRESRTDAVMTERMLFQILFSNIRFRICNFVDLLHYAFNHIRGFVSLQLMSASRSSTCYALQSAASFVKM